MLIELLSWEGFWWCFRRARRSSAYEQAKARAANLSRPLVVVGAPDGGLTAGYGCGDLIIDLFESGCPRAVQADICEAHAIPLDDDSAVVFVACVLEYVQDHQAAIQELLRVAGSLDNIFVVSVEPWTLASVLYPGARRVVTTDGASEIVSFTTVNRRLRL